MTATAAIDLLLIVADSLKMDRIWKKVQTLVPVSSKRGIFWNYPLLVLPDSSQGI
jgi:hypothetical protein